MNNRQLYKIYLEDYSFPRHASFVKAYYGTQDDIVNLITQLADNNWTNTRYKETIEAAYSYDTEKESPFHTVAGQVFPFLTPVQEVCRFETQLTDQRWKYTAYGDKLYPCWASVVDVCQNLIRAEDGYERCVKACISNLHVCYHNSGWTLPNSTIKGFPGIVTWDGECHTLNLFVSLAHYDLDDLATATADVSDTSLIDLSAITADILAEG